MECEPLQHRHASIFLEVRIFGICIENRLPNVPHHMKVRGLNPHEAFKDVKVAPGQVLNFVNVYLVINVREPAHRRTYTRSDDFQGELGQVKLVCATSSIKVAFGSSCIPAANGFSFEVKTSKLLFREQQGQVGADTMTQEESEPTQDFWDGSRCTFRFESTFQLGLARLRKSYY